jgi:glycosyltransferase involved in cell wall biosynthesis
MPDPPKLSPIAAEALSVVLLAHAGTIHLEPVVAGWVAFLDGLRRDYEVILVDDGTGTWTAGLPERYPRVRVLVRPDAWGEGAALRAALEVASHPLLFYTLCDPRYQPEDLGLLLEKRHDAKKPEVEIDQVHLLSGCRVGRPMPWPLRTLGLVWRLVLRVALSHAPPRLPGWLGWRAHAGFVVVRAVLGVRYHDPTCPFRLLRREVFSRIPLQSNGLFVHVEIVAKANFLGHVLGEEVPLGPGHHPPVDEPRVGGGWRQLRTEFWRVLTRAEFGPSVVPGPSKLLPESFPDENENVPHGKGDS